MRIVSGRDPGSVHDNLRRAMRAQQAILGQIPDMAPRRESRRHDERRRLLRTAGGGGRERAELHDRLNRDLMAIVINLGIVTEAIAELFHAGVRDDSVGLNRQAITVLLRAPIESAARVHWLLREDVDPAERVRRYLVWRLADCASLRALMDSTEVGGDAPAELEDADEGATPDLDAEELKILGWADSAKWKARRRQVVSGSEQAPALLSEVAPHKAVAMPKNGELVAELVGADSFYPALCVSAHGDRWSITDTKVATNRRSPDGRSLFAIEGFGLEPNTLKEAATLALVRPTLQLAEWNGVSAAGLDEPVKRLKALSFTDN